MFISRRVHTISFYIFNGLVATLLWTAIYGSRCIHFLIAEFLGLVYDLDVLEKVIKSFCVASTNIYIVIVFGFAWAKSGGVYQKTRGE